jgi:hypothetical protein
MIGNASDEESPAQPGRVHAVVGINTVSIMYTVATRPT